MTIWAYHATRKRDLPKIARVGLLPQRQPVRHDDEPRVTREEVLFFAPTEGLASIWNEVVLRFPWPEEYEEDYYGDTMFVGGDVVRTSNFTYDSVDPEKIQVRVGRRWRGLR